MTGGLDAWIGEAGQRLSAGERARVAVARALLSPAPRLLLDEPTAHLDHASARALLDLLAGLDRSVLLVTDRADDLDARWCTVHLASFEGRPERAVTSSSGAAERSGAGAAEGARR